MMFLQTPDALAFAHLEKQDFDQAIVRGLYPIAPKTRPGVMRNFDTDDLIAAFVLGWLLERDVTPAAATTIACQVHGLVKRDHTIQTLSAWKVTPRNGTARTVVAERQPNNPSAIELFKFEIADIRMRAIDGIREKLRGDHAKAGA
jgi:hypothetical protein